MFSMLSVSAFDYMFSISLLILVPIALAVALISFVRD